MSLTILWQRLDGPGHDTARLVPHGGEWRLHGVAVFESEHGPCVLDYEVRTRPDWVTTGATLRGFVGDRPVRLKLTRGAGGNWSCNGRPQSELAGCSDVDLGFTPATNLLPIRRLGDALADPTEVTAAWLPFPSLTPEPLSQIYQRLAPDRYRYVALDSEFHTTLTVHASGLVLEYPDRWRAVAPPIEQDG